MEFMRPFIADRTQISTFGEETPPNGEEENNEQNERREKPSTSCSKRSRSPVTSSATILKEYLDVKRKKLTHSGDHLTKYFQSCEETVRRFPEQLQVEAKKKISDILYELEMKSLQHTYNYYCIPTPHLSAPEGSNSSISQSETHCSEGMERNATVSDFIELK